MLQVARNVRVSTELPYHVREDTSVEKLKIMKYRHVLRLMFFYISFQLCLNIFSILSYRRGSRATHGFSLRERYIVRARKWCCLKYIKKRKGYCYFLDLIFLSFHRFTSSLIKICSILQHSIAFLAPECNLEFVHKNRLIHFPSKFYFN